MRLTSLTAVALMGAALLVPMGTATAAAETCDGRPATIVGAPGTQITGTNGADVIVTNGATRVNAGPGKDVIRHSVEYGDGDELSTPRCGTYRAVVNGGRGRDTIYGGPGDDRLIGGRGFDTIDGDFGRDVCQGEKVRRCERRL